jgi:uncharacterized protein DUF3617
MRGRLTLLRAWRRFAGQVLLRGFGPLEGLPVEAAQRRRRVMKRGPFLLAGLLAAAGCEGERPREMNAADVAAELAELRIEPGLWELTSAVTEVRAPDLPLEVRNRMVGPRSRMRHCISAEQARQPSANFLAVRSDGACTYQDVTLVDGRLRGAMSCPGATARMDGHYGSHAYEMRMEMESPMPGGASMMLEVQARGRRIGDC